MRLNLFLLANLSRSDSSSALTRASSRATLSSRFFLAINSSDGLGAGGGGGGGGGAVTAGVVTAGVVTSGVVTAGVVVVVVVVTGAALFFRFKRPDINQTSPLNNSQPPLGHTFLIYTLHQNIVIWQTLLLSDGHILQLFAS
jgi:hypothetical protein